ncbi:MAG TPA: GMC family oxidoreductase [Alphaproteobacteria bacterium]|nr:GMC family oxidoreductase [Alphaproteobacteria bacterium]
MDAAICIIGGGAAGITLALEFAGTPLDAVVVESGGLTYNSATQALARGAVVGLDYSDLEGERVRQLGGSTEHWGGECRPLAPEDLLPRPWIPHSGWPIQADDLVPYFKRADRTVEIAGYEQFATPDWDSVIRRLPPLEALRFEGGNVVPRAFQNSPPTRFGQRYRGDLERAANVRVLLNANLVGFETNETRRQVRSAQVACLGGPRFAIQARTYVLSTGTIENARILLAAGEPDRQGLGNAHDVVGRYFHEHVAFQSVAALLPARRAALEPYKALRSQATVAAAFTEAAQRDRQLSNFTIFFDPRAAGSEEPSVRSFQALVGGARAGRVPNEVLSHLGEVLSDLPAVARYAWNRLSSRDEAVGFFDLTLLMEQIPNPDSRVWLGRERDALGIPIAELEWRLTDLDRVMLLRALEHTAREVGAGGVGRIQIRIAEDGHDAMGRLTHSSHPMGTTRMHDDPRQGVVDRNCRVHGMANLYVAGASVFTTGGAASPTYNLVALAIRLADHIKTLPA